MKSLELLKAEIETAENNPSERQFAYVYKILNAEIKADYEMKYYALSDAIYACLNTANGRQSEWGDRAESCFDILLDALEKINKKSP